MQDNELNDEELNWLFKRAHEEKVPYLPHKIRNRIIELGYGTPDAQGAFTLTSKGRRYLYCHRPRTPRSR